LTRDSSNKTTIAAKARGSDYGQLEAGKLQELALKLIEQTHFEITSAADVEEIWRNK